MIGVSFDCNDTKVFVVDKNPRHDSQNKNYRHCSIPNMHLFSPMNVILASNKIKVKENGDMAFSLIGETIL